MPVYERLSAAGATAPDPRSAQLDAVRALAVLMVLAGHAYLVGGAVPPQTSRAPSDMLINAGGAGIWLCFSLSDLLIAAPFLRALEDGAPLPSLRRYALRRPARILPAYWVALAVMLLVLPPAALAWWQLPLHAALLHNLVPGEGQALFFVAWTLGIEALFYAFVALAAVAVRRLRGPAPIPAPALLRGIATLWAASVVYAIAAALAFPGEGMQAVSTSAASSGRSPRAWPSSRRCTSGRGGSSGRSRRSAWSPTACTSGTTSSPRRSSTAGRASRPGRSRGPFVHWWCWR
jgi:peptidoglycan/LPS O-acetylase OafA/YrhL